MEITLEMVRIKTAYWVFVRVKKGENVSTYSAIGFCMQASRCRNVFAKNVRFERKGNQMHVGSRDAWKLYSCRRTAVI